MARNLRSVTPVVNNTLAPITAPLRSPTYPESVPCTPTVRLYARAVAEDRLRVSGSCVIGLDELEWSYSGSGGPGGQHANTANTRVDLRFDIEGSRSLGPRQKARLVERFGPVVRVVVSDSRSQHRNREIALERLTARLASGLRIETPRKPTKVKRSAKEKRLKDKRQQSERKRARARPTDE